MKGYEAFLALRPVTDAELLKMLGAVCHGPVKSWWQAAKKKHFSPGLTQRAVQGYFPTHWLFN